MIKMLAISYGIVVDLVVKFNDLYSPNHNGTSGRLRQYKHLNRKIGGI
jgi:hypothetical protein